jgi:hypothetical protein
VERRCPVHLGRHAPYWHARGGLQFAGARPFLLGPDRGQRDHRRGADPHSDACSHTDTDAGSDAHAPSDAIAHAEAYPDADTPSHPIAHAAPDADAHLTGDADSHAPTDADAVRNRHARRDPHAGRNGRTHTGIGSDANPWGDARHDASSGLE